MINKNSTFKEFEELGLEKVQATIETYIGATVFFETIEKAYDWWITFNKKFYLIDNDAPDGFTSISSAYIFYLTKLEGKQRNKLLGITDDLYSDSKKASKWFKNISKYVHPDANQSNDKDGAAFKELKKLYDVMTDEDEEIEDEANG